MRAVILAAGRGSRMRDLTSDRPKCLLELGGRTLLDWQLRALEVAGITEIAIVTGYRRELLAGRVLTEFHNARWAETNMVSSLECAGSWLEAGPCIVCYSDIFFDASAPRSLLASDADIAVLYDRHWLRQWQKRFDDPLADAETFRLGADGRLAEIGNTPRSVDDVDGQYMGLLRFTPAGWGELQRIREVRSRAERDSMHMTGTLQKIIEADRLPIAAVEYSGEWGEVDSPNDLSLYQGEVSRPFRE